MSPRTAKQYEGIRKERQELLKATALRLFSANGYQATSISTIAKEAGISKGLMYNYFESKEELLVSLFDDYFRLLGALLNPNNDNEITNDEMESFFGMLTQSLREKHEYWLLFFQLSMQPDVLQLILSKMQHAGVVIEHRNLLWSYFADRFENAAEEFLLFNAVIKGFSLIYVLGPEHFTPETTAALLARIKKMFIRENCIPVHKKKPVIHRKKQPVHYQIFQHKSTNR
jgi:AcrR family transcriptional regulator